MNPRTITFEQAKQELDLQTQADRDAQRYYDGDHWNNGNDFIGPVGPIEERATILPQIKKAFIWRNMVGETVDRSTGATVGANPHWKYAGVESLTKTAEEIQTGWLSERLIPYENTDDASPLIEFARYLLLQRRAPMRLFVPAIHRNEQGQIEQADLAISLDKLEFHAAAPAQCAVLVDSRTRERYGVYVYSEEDDNGATTERAEVCYVDRATKRTVIRILEDGKDPLETSLDLGGRLTIYEGRRPALIREDVLSLQRALNMSLTMRSRNVEVAGFLATILTNAQLPGHYEGEGPNRTFRYDPVALGAGTLNNFIGIKVRDANGNETYTTPGIHDRQPVDVTVFDQTEQAIEAHLLQRVHQLHTKLSGDATSSGEARKQALADFILDLNVTATQVAGMLRWLLETSLAWASDFAGQPGAYTDLRANVKCRLKPGPIDSELLRVYRELWDAGFASHELLLSESGLTDDVDSELQRLRQEQEDRFNRELSDSQRKLETSSDRVNEIIAKRQARTGITQ